MNVNEIIGKRLKTARIMRGFSMDDLCSGLDHKLSKQTISNYESAKSVPNSTQLISIANALGMKPDYFFRPFSVSISNIEFRVKPDISVKEENSIKEIIRDRMERYLEIESVLDILHSYKKMPSQNITTADDILKFVSYLKKDWKLGIAPIASVTNLLEEKGIIVLEVETSDKFEGLSGYAGNDIPVIALNANISSERKRFVALHELCHLLLKFDSSLTSKNIEELCDLFASEMLISGNELKRLLGVARHDISLNELRSIQSTYGISIKQIMKRSNQLCIISDSRYKYFCADINKNPALKIQIEKSIFKNEESHRFESMVYRALASEMISFSKASELLNLSVAEIREQLELV